MFQFFVISRTGRIKQRVGMTFFNISLVYPRDSCSPFSEWKIPIQSTTMCFIGSFNIISGKFYSILIFAQRLSPEKRVVNKWFNTLR